MHASLVVAALVWIFVGAVFIIFIRGAGAASKHSRPSRELTPREMRRIEMVWAVRTGLLGGVFLVLLAVVFIEHGCLVRLIIGG